MLTGVVLTKNEEKNIKKCLESISFCDQKIVIDDFSEDKTVEIAKRMGAKVFRKKLENDFAAQRNFALEKAYPGWVLFVDADEIVTSQLAKEIQKFVKNPQGTVGAYLKREDVLFGKKLKYGETGKTKLLRLGRRDAGKWQRRVHETWDIQGNIIKLNSTLFHYPHPTITDFLKEINRYSTLHAQVFYEERKKTDAFEIIFYPLGKFLQNYIIRLGFLDGMPGLIVALMMSLHSFLARSKLYSYWKKGPPEYFKIFNDSNRYNK